MKKLSPQRRRVILLCSSLAALSGTLPLLMQRHRMLGLVWVVFMLALLATAVTEFIRLKRREG